MRLSLAFADGRIQGDGRDTIGPFAMRGTYDTDSGKVTIHKRYLMIGGLVYDVLYDGWAEEGRGIWGVWQLAIDRGGFHLWPEGMADPTGSHLGAEADAPEEAGEPTEDIAICPSAVPPS